jgi:hypothetical protein
MSTSFVEAVVTTVTLEHFGAPSSARDTLGGRRSTDWKDGPSDAPLGP